ncbi:MAG: hypothetical protein AMXMBFR64_19050 [Myxococcales bacterium]
MKSDFTRAEIEELKGLVDVRAGELGAEIHHAMVHEYRDGLKARKALLEKLSVKLGTILQGPGEPE